MSRRSRWLGLLLILSVVGCKKREERAPTASLVQSDAGGDLHEQVVRVPLQATTDGGEQTFMLETTLYRPAGNGPFPAVIINHGSPRAAEDRRGRGRERLVAQSRWFIERGFVVAMAAER